MDVERANKQITCLTFRLGDELFGLNTKNVVQISEMRTIRKVPGSAEYITGKIHWNAKQIIVLDTRKRLGLSGESATPYSSIIIIKANNREPEEKYFGMIVDMVEEIVDIRSFNIHPVPSSGIRFRSGFIANIAQWKESYIMMLDTEQLITNNQKDKYKSQINQLAFINN